VSPDETWSLEEDGAQRRVHGGGVVVDVPYSESFLHALAVHRPGLSLVDELLRSEHAAYIHARLRLLFEPFSARSGWRVLDFGCGAGASSVILCRLGVGRVVGVDLVNAYAPLYRQRLAEAGFPDRGTFVQAGDSLALPFRAGTFDAVLLNGVLEHLVPEERTALLREALRLLAPGGHLFVAETPNRWFPRNSHTKLWFSEWLPFAWAARLALRFGPRRDFPRHGRTARYRTGMRGMSIEQIRRILGTAALELPVDENLVRLEFTLPRNPLEAGARRGRGARAAWRALVGVARLLGRPPAHLSPHLKLVFRRTHLPVSPRGPGPIAP
jgi:ubiquinone/menaquinone biosynthesis C-methylase UbiE